MRQLFLDKGVVAIKEVCRPLLDDYSVLVSVSYSFLASGQELSELVQKNNTRFFHNVPTKVRTLIDLLTHKGGAYVGNFIKDRFSGRIVPVGNSCSGRVVAVGKKVQRFRVGDLVACVGDGFAYHAEIICVPEQLVVRVSDESFLKEASLVGVGAIALQSVRRASLSIGESVCVCGMDSLGQMIALIAKSCGCRVFALDVNSQKLEQAQKFGIARTFLSSALDVHEEMAYETGFHGVDCCILTPEYMNDLSVNGAIDNTRKRGRIVLVGKQSVAIKQDRVQSKEIDVLFSLAYGPGRYDVAYEYQGIDYPYEYVRWTENRNMYAFMHLVQNRQVCLDHLLGKELSLAQLTQTIVQETVQTGIGAVIAYKHVESATVHTLKTESFIPARRDPTDKLNVTFFGANRVTRLSLMPVLKSIKNIEVHRIIDRNISSALNAAKQYPRAYALSGEPELFCDDPVTDVVCVTSTHGLHTEHLIKALKNGKAIYLQRTLSLTEEDFTRFADFLRTHHTSRLCLGYYKSMSPFMQKVKHALVQRRSPLMLTYRININSGEDHDSVDHRPRHGTVIDKASHVFDLFCFLTQARPTVVSVETARSSQDDVFSTDNFSVHVGFDDGSLCVLHVTSLGHQGAGSERMEVSFDGKTIVMEDFVKLCGYGLARSFDEVVRVADFGQSAHFKQFFSDLSITDKSALFDKNKIMMVAQLTMQVDRLAGQGGGELSVRI